MSPAPKDALWDLLTEDDEDDEEAVEQQEDDQPKDASEEDVADKRRIADVVEEWFFENFEPPAHGSTYDEYIWGGPFDVRSILTTHFPYHMDEDGDELTDFIVEELEQKSRAWVPSGSRIEPLTKVDVPKTAAEAFVSAQRHARALKDLLSRIPEQPAGVGHNRPPEPLDDTPLDADDRKQLAVALDIIETQTVEPLDKGRAAKQAAVVIETKMHKVGNWLARQGDTFATEAVKEAGRHFGKWMPRAFWLLLMDRMLSVSDTITHWLNLAFPSF